MMHHQNKFEDLYSQYKYENSRNNNNDLIRQPQPAPLTQQSYQQDKNIRNNDLQTKQNEYRVVSYKVYSTTDKNTKHNSQNQNQTNQEIQYYPNKDINQRNQYKFNQKVKEEDNIETKYLTQQDKQNKLKTYQNDIYPATKRYILDENSSKNTDKDQSYKKDYTFKKYIPSIQQVYEDSKPAYYSPQILQQPQFFKQQEQKYEAPSPLPQPQINKQISDITVDKYCKPYFEQQVKTIYQIKDGDNVKNKLYDLKKTGFLPQQNSYKLQNQIQEDKTYSNQQYNQQNYSYRQIKTEGDYYETPYKIVQDPYLKILHNQKIEEQPKVQNQYNYVQSQKREEKNQQQQLPTYLQPQNVQQQPKLQQQPQYYAQQHTPNNDIYLQDKIIHRDSKIGHKKTEAKYKGVIEDNRKSYQTDIMLLDPKKFDQRLRDYVYNIKDFLGQGTFGKVYKGYNIYTEEIIAVKQMEKAMFTNQQMLETLKTEIHVMKELKSKHVVRMYDVIETELHTNIILEICNDGDLEQLLEKKQNGRIQEKDAINILFQVMKGFRDLTNHGYIHRDVKPANTLIHGDIFKLADFGMAAKVDIHGAQYLQESCGSPLYMAPQLLENKVYTAKSDIWSVGLMFYEMLFGKTPWPARDIESLRHNIRSMPLRFPYDVQIGKNTKDFITQCLQIEEKDRIDWDQIFQHPIIHDTGNIEEIFEFDQRSKNIIQEIQTIVQVKHLDLHNIFDEFDSRHENKLNVTQFYNLLHSFDQRITFYEAQHLFDILDSSEDQFIEFDEFKEIFLTYDFVDLNNKAQIILHEIKDILKHKHVDLQQLFYKYDKDQNGLLYLQEFSELMKQFLPGMKQSEVTICFKAFDDDNSGNIDFQEFKDHLHYGIKHLHDSYNPQKEKGIKIVQQIQDRSHYTNDQIIELFQQYDDDMDNFLNYSEFTNFMKHICPCVHTTDIKSVFQYFDEDSNQLISLDEFIQGFVQEYSRTNFSRQYI